MAVPRPVYRRFEPDTGKDNQAGTPGPGRHPRMCGDHNVKKVDTQRLAERAKPKHHIGPARLAA